MIFASWYDAGTGQGTIQRFRDFSNPQGIFIGAWRHGANSDADPLVTSTAVQPDAEQQRLEAPQPLHTYTHRDAQPVPEYQEIEANLTLLPISVLLKKGTRLRLSLASGPDATLVS